MSQNWNNDLFTNVQQEDLLVSCVRCLAHSIQLVVNNGIKKAARKVRTLIALCRTIAKALRVQSVENHLKSLNLFRIRPKLDVPTRWSSTFSMVSIYYLAFSPTNLISDS